MRVGWVELVSSAHESGFRATVAGQRVVRYDSLPAVTRSLSRRGSFAIDQVSGTVFRARDLTLYSQARIDKIKENTEVIVLPRDIEKPRPQVDEVISTLLEDDEHCKGVEPSGGKLTDRFALVRVSGQAIDGLPARAPDSLKQKIQMAVESVASSTTRTPQAPLGSDGASGLPRPLDIVFSHQDLVLGGPAHRKTLELLLRKARSRVVIHSTFVYADKFGMLLPLMKDAARRGVRIDILWGKSPEASSSKATESELEKCRAQLDDDYLIEKVRLHSFTTKSHAKILLADNGRGQIVAVIGSCNWLSTGFDSYEVSAYFSDPMIVADIAGKLASMTVGAAGYWTDLTRDLGAQAATLRHASRPRGSQVRARIVLGGEHDSYVRMARDEATRRIVIASHRFSDNAETAVLIPAQAAIEAHGIDVTLLYGRTSGPHEGKLAKSLANSASDHGIRLKQILRPRLHAKFLAWDNDNVVITSQNWLSADPPDTTPYAEVGVYLSGHGIAQELVDLTELALMQQ